MKAGKGKKRRVVPAGPAEQPVASRSLASAVLELRRAQHRAAVLEHLAQRLFADYSAEEAEPTFLIKTGTEAPVLADPDALIEAAGLLARAAEEARRRVQQILLVQLPTGPGPETAAGAEPSDDDGERFISRVVMAPAPTSPSWRGENS